MRRGAGTGEAIDAVCVGEVIWDVFDRGARLLFREPGGASVNVAIGLARLGMRPALAGAVGRDRVGEALVARLDAEGIDTRAIARRPERTGVTFIDIAEDGEPSFTNYRKGTADGVPVRTVPRAPWTVVASSSVAPPRAPRSAVALDLNARPLLWTSRAAAAREAARLVARSALVKASERDLEALVPGRGIRWLRANARPGAVLLVTRGPRGARALGDGFELDVTARRARLVDATGAGDAFLAGVLAALSAARVGPGSAAWRDDAFWADALDIGNRMGAKAVSRLGATRGLVGLEGLRLRVQRLGARWRSSQPERSEGTMMRRRSEEAR